MAHQFRVSVIEKDLFVSSDMVHTIRSVLPSVDCSVFSTVGEARNAPQPSNEPLLVLISANADGDLVFDDDSALWLLKRKVIAFDCLHRRPYKDWIFLSKPFAEADLKSAVLSLVQSEPLHEGEQQGMH